ncbi:catalase 1 [Aspergillus melleus]|uniref:Catalase 1 n=1 Tax=Aspergillus melleus TaxID=138277 RepID=A0ACC3AWM3_9EURO|nr:catalase 1 [Aspergillus melleus]
MSIKQDDIARDIVELSGAQHMTTDFGVKISDPDHWLRVGQWPAPIGGLARSREDHAFRSIPERVVHARGVGAFGTFRMKKSISDLTTAGVFTDTSRETPVFTRFSTVQGSKGSADTVRDVRGFAVKMYTSEGNWDIVGNNIPVFFIQDAIKFPDIVHAVKPEPHNEIPQGQSAHNNFWDFAYMHSETTHMQQWIMSDRAIPRSLRMMQRFGVNIYSLVNAEGKCHFVKFHWTPELGVHSLIWDEAFKIAGQDPDFHRKDLMDAIDAGQFPKWKFGIQVIPQENKDDFKFDIEDATKIWPEELVPIQYVGELELNRNVDEYFPQTEQVAFCTSHIVPGIDFSNDPLLIGRNFSYFDTQISRLGPNWQELPINRPMCPYMSLVNRNGAMKHRITKGKVNYWSNRYETDPPASPSQGGFATYPEKQEGVKARQLSDKFKEHYNQAQLSFNSLLPVEKMHVAKAFSLELDHCNKEVVYKRLSERLAVVDLNLAQTVAKNVGGDTPTKATKANNGQTSKGLSQFDYLSDGPQIATRRVAILIMDGFDHAAYTQMKETLQEHNAFVFTIGSQRQGVTAKSGEKVIPDHDFPGMRSTLFDAVFIPGGKRPVAGINEAVGFIQRQINLDAVKHASSAGQTVESYGVVTGQGNPAELLKSSSTIGPDGQGFIERFIWQISRHRDWQRELDGLIDEVAA